MGAGGRSGPHEQQRSQHVEGEVRQGGSSSGSAVELRHEYAADEQRVRHCDVVERSLNRLRLATVQRVAAATLFAF